MYCRVFTAFVFCIFSLLINLIGTKNSPELKQLNLLFRHGERAPTETYPNDPHKNFKWSGGWGHLTTRGKLQMYKLGEKFRSTYGYFIPDLYWPKHVNVTSSYIDRCLMSAELVSAGLYPPKGDQIWNYDLLWQPIPIHYLPRALDNSIVMKSSCQKYDEIFKNVLKSDKVKEILERNDELLKHLTKHTGWDVEDVETVEKLFNTLEIESLHNLTLPSWVNSAIMENMKQLGARNLAFYSETEFMKRMKGGVFLNNVIAKMEDSLKGEKSPILNLYSGHDLTLVHVLRSLKLVDTIKPGFGAYLIFELYSDGVVKIFYGNAWNENRVEKMLPGCGSPCSIQDFKTALTDVLPVDWLKECGVN